MPTLRRSSVLAEVHEEAFRELPCSASEVAPVPRSFQLSCFEGIFFGQVSFCSTMSWSFRKHAFPSLHIFQLSPCLISQCQNPHLSICLHSRHGDCQAQGQMQVLSVMTKTAGWGLVGIVVRGPESESLSVAQAGLKLMEVLLTQPPKFWDDRCKVPALF